MNTGATTSAITYLDGEEGILRYRGYPIEQLAEKCEFLEVSYLLIYGELPPLNNSRPFKNALKLIRCCTRTCVPFTTVSSRCSSDGDPRQCGRRALGRSTKIHSIRMIQRY